MTCTPITPLLFFFFLTNTFQNYSKTTQGHPKGLNNFYKNTKYQMLEYFEGKSCRKQADLKHQGLSSTVILMEHINVTEH
jgi:hypothetical protein